MARFSVLANLAVAIIMVNDFWWCVVALIYVSHQPTLNSWLLKYSSSSLFTKDMAAPIG
jgi:hypothetical protein